MSSIPLRPSQLKPTQRDESYEQGFLFGRASIIRAVREALARGDSIPSLIEELEHVQFTR